MLAVPGAAACLPTQDLPWPDDSPSLWDEGEARYQELVQISL